MKRLVVFPVVVLFLCMACGGDDCPTCPRPPGASGSPPVISILQCNPSSAGIGEGGGAITMDCSLFFTDQDGDMDTVVFRYLDGCGADPGPFSVDVSGQAGVQHQGTVQIQDLIIQTSCAAGTYTYEFTALDVEQNESNALTLSFVLE
jgi:hypothetical protein